VEGVCEWMSMEGVSEFSMCIASFPGHFQFHHLPVQQMIIQMMDGMILQCSFHIARHMQCVCTGLGM